jgi:tetratricopeptide (TPR) repeat protein
MTEESAIVRQLIFDSEEQHVIRSRIACGSSRWPVLKSLLLMAVLAIARPAAADESTCGTLRTAWGPFDYRSASVRQIQIVEDYHFTPEVEMLKRGKSNVHVGADIDYTLRAFPNHHRALAAMANLQFKAKTDLPIGAHWRVSCYFDRAIRFRPDDATVRTIFGIYMMRLGKTADAITQFEMAAKLGDDSGNLHYNAGLTYFELGDYDKALAHAKKAYDLGFTLPGLREKLAKIGKWPSE